MGVVAATNACACRGVVNRFSGTRYTVGEFTDSVKRTDHDGAAPVPPAGAVNWTADAEGTGTQTMRWDASDRPQIVFAMNAAWRDC